MESFGGSIAAFAESIQGVDSSAADNAYYTYRVVDNINNCLGELKDSSLPNSWTKYEDAMTGLGDLIDIFVDSFANLNMDTINVAESALAEIGAVYDLSTSMRGNASVPNASVTSNFKSFCSALTVIAPNIHSFVHQMNSTSSTSISTSVSKLKEIVDLASSVKSVDLSALSTLSSSLSSLSSLDFGSDKFQNGGEQFTKGINSMMNAASKSIMTSGTKMSTAMTKVIDSVGKAAQKQAPKFSATGATYALKLASGLSSNGAKVSSGASTVAASGANAASRYYSNYYKAGANLVSGFARGIRDYTYLSVSASKEMAQKALTAAQRILKEHSPSRAMYQVGAYAGEGFANGLTAYNGISYNAGETIANQAINAMRDAVSSVNAVLASDLDNAPTIRPVMDLSDVQSGMSMIGSIFNSNGLASYSSARGVTRMLNSRMRVADTADVINAVRDLKSSIAERPGNTYQINGITYDDGSNIADAVKTIVHAVTTERRI